MGRSAYNADIGAWVTVEQVGDEFKLEISESGQGGSDYKTCLLSREEAETLKMRLDILLGQS